MMAGSKLNACVASVASERARADRKIGGRCRYRKIRPAASADRRLLSPNAKTAMAAGDNVSLLADSPPDMSNVPS